MSVRETSERSRRRATDACACASAPPLPPGRVALGRAASHGRMRDRSSPPPPLPLGRAAAAAGPGRMPSPRCRRAERRRRRAPRTHARNLLAAAGSRGTACAQQGWLGENWQVDNPHCCLAELRRRRRRVHSRDGLGGRLVGSGGGQSVGTVGAGRAKKNRPLV